ncbi:hypothetical protein [Mycobacteroides abscessus]|uniref:hypothetical protein n=1 Tax=Mycobacteroides abscessus TaxID=36809 RepID=UPI001877757C|nr:hypothetical protein [Mycobacteroides abscessus]
MAAARWWYIALSDPYSLQTHLVGTEALTLDLFVGDLPGALVVPLWPNHIAALRITQHILPPWFDRLPVRVNVAPQLWVLALTPPGDMGRPWRVGSPPGDHTFPRITDPHEIVLKLPVEERPNV